MSDAFDPYHVWLGIPPDEQPPNRYRLLGIRLFEANPDVVDNAADRQTAHLRTLQTGQHAKLSQRLLNEVSAARVCLLNPAAKAKYDLQLRGALPTARTQPAAAPLAPAQSSPTAAESDWDALMGASAVSSPLTAGKRIRKTRTHRKSSNAPKFVAVGIAVVLAAAVCVVAFVMSHPSEATLTFDWPAADRAGAALTIDGQAISIPPSGPWEFKCAPGDHKIVAERPAYKFEATATAAGGESQAISAAWKPKALLVIHWPLAMRSGGELTVDNLRQTVTQQDPLEIAVEPGKHVVQISQPKYLPFQTTAEPLAGSLISINPAWFPDPTVLHPPLRKPPATDASIAPDKPAASDASPADVAVVKTIPPRPTSKPPATAGSLPRGEWVDLLRLADPSADAVYGKWLRDGDDLVCEQVVYARLRLPVEVTGSYDLEVEFTRKKGGNDVVAILPVGGRVAMVMLSASNGKASGLHHIGGHFPSDPANPYAIRPGRLDNNRRYRLAISVRVFKDDVASIDVTVQDKPAWPQWKGPLTALEPVYDWALPGARQIGIGSWHNQVQFHSVRLRVLSGDATIAPAFTEPPPTIVIMSARWGGSSKVDVTERVRDAIRNGQPVLATSDFLKSDPDPGGRKSLEIKFEKSGKRQSAHVDEGDAWKLEDQLK